MMVSWNRVVVLEVGGFVGFWISGRDNRNFNGWNVRFEKRETNQDAKSFYGSN